MNGKKLIGMAVALAVLVAIAVMQKKGGATAGAQKSGKDSTLLEDVDLNAVTALDVVEGSNSVALVKKGGIWSVGSLHGYPVDFDKLADAMRNAAQVKLGKPVRAANVALSEFGLGDKATKVVLKTGDATVASLEIGARREASDTAGWANQHFVRKSGSEAIYLVDYDFRPFSKTPEDWIKKDLLSVRSDDIVSVKAGDVEMKIDGADWKLVGLDEAKEEVQASEAGKLRMALQYLNCTTVADPAKTDAELGFDKPAIYTAKTKDGFTYTVRFGSETNGNRYARFAVEYAKSAPPAAPEAGADQAKQDAYKKQLEAFNSTTESNTKKAEELNAKLSRWTYVLSGSEANDFLIGRDKLVKQKEPPPEAKPAEKADAATPAA